MRHVKKDKDKKKTLVEVLSIYIDIHTCFELTEKMEIWPKNKKCTNNMATQGKQSRSRVAPFWKPFKKYPEHLHKKGNKFSIEKRLNFNNFEVVSLWPQWWFSKKRSKSNSPIGALRRVCKVGATLLWACCVFSGKIRKRSLRSVALRKS